MVVPALTLPVPPAVTALTDDRTEPGKGRKCWLKGDEMEKGCGQGHQVESPMSEQGGGVQHAFSMLGSRLREI